METFTAVTRRVGNSVGLLIPRKILEKEKLSTGFEVEVTISPCVSDDLFGKFRKRLSKKDLDDFVEENKDAWGN